jgi:hypothetical protein
VNYQSFSAAANRLFTKFLDALSQCRAIPVVIGLQRREAIGEKFFPRRLGGVYPDFQLRHSIATIAADARQAA